MMNFIPFLESPENRNRVVCRRLFDVHRLEPTFKRRVFFDVGAIFVQGRGPDQMKFPSREHGLEQIGRIDRALGGPRADDGVEFIDKEQNFPVGRLNFFQHGFQPFLKFPSKFCPCHQGAHVQTHHPFPFQAFRHVALDDALGQPLHNGGFSDAGFTDEHGIIFCSSG